MQTGKILAADSDGHHDFLEGAIARAFADAIEGALHLPGAGLDGGQRVGDGQPQVIVAMHADHCLIDVLHVVAQIADQRGILLRNGESNGVGDIDRVGPGVDGGLNNAGQELRLRARSILGRELDILHQRLCPFHALNGQPDDLLLGLLQFEFPMNGGGCQENMDSRPFAGGFDRGPGRVNVLRHAAGQPADDWALDFLSNSLHRLEVTAADHRKTGLDHIDVEPSQLAGDLHFFAQVHTGARALLAIAKRRIEDNYIVRHRMNGLSGEEWRKGSRHSPRPPERSLCRIMKGE